jgi:hypothetical protein
MKTEDWKNEGSKLKRCLEHRNSNAGKFTFGGSDGSD